MMTVKRRLCFINGFYGTPLSHFSARTLNTFTTVQPCVAPSTLLTSSAHAAMTKHKPVLVTGATGFLGSHLCPQLEKNGYDVFTLSRRSNLELDTGPSSLFTRSDQKDRHFACDLTQDSHVLSSILESRPWFAIIHLAGLISYSPADNRRMVAVNIEATHKLVQETCRSCPSAKFVYCSSVVAVGSNKSVSDPLLTEDAVWDHAFDRIGYPHTKKIAEDIVLDAGKKKLLKTVAFCPSNIYGPGDAAKSSRKSQIRAANGNAKLYTQGGVSIVHVDVVVDAFVKAVNTDRENPIWNGSRWLLTGDNVTVRDMLVMCAQEGGNPNHVPFLCPPFFVLVIVCWIAQLFGSRSLTVDRVTLASRFHWYDSEKTRQKFSLKHVSARDAVADSVQWMRERGMVSKKP